MFRGMDQHRLGHELCSEVHRARLRDGEHKLQQRKFQSDVRKRWFTLSMVSAGDAPQRGGNLFLGDFSRLDKTLSSLMWL